MLHINSWRLASVNVTAGVIRRTIKVRRLNMSETEKNIHEKGWKMCRQLLRGAWNSSHLEDTTVQTVSGGLSNYLYMCELSDDIDLDDTQPRKVLMRIYGTILQENASQLVLDSVIFALLSEKELGPKLYGVFKQGRLEQYIPSRSMETAELQDADNSRKIASIMAKFHRLNMPICKEPKWLFGTMNKWLKQIKKNSIIPSSNDRNASQHAKLNNLDLQSELSNLKSILDQVPSPVCFCHNDLQEGNILVMEPKKNDNNEPNLMAIDFEYCSYNYRGFDMGNHFNEWCYDYSVDKPPYYSVNYNNYPSKEQQTIFIKSYLAAYNKGDFSDSEIQDVIQEANTYALASHLFWGLWSLVCSYSSDIKFGYLDYAWERFDCYFRMKAKLKFPRED